jgi:hypothetical protein
MNMKITCKNTSVYSKYTVLLDIIDTQFNYFTNMKSFVVSNFPKFLQHASIRLLAHALRTIPSGLLVELSSPAGYFIW